jgi:hypothetical protein
LGQLALANFANEEGLQRVGSTDYTETLASGQAVIGAPGTGGRGTLAGGSLELSNVDISTEFANLIVAQRAFEANAKAVTTFDQITQDTINLKQAPAHFKRFDVLWTPTVLFLDSSGIERRRIEGYLPRGEFSAQLELALGRIAFMHKQWAEAEKWYNDVEEVNR